MKQDTVNATINDGKTNHKVVFHKSKGLGLPLPDHISADVADSVNKAHLQILPFEDELLQWIGASDQNVLQFMSDPLKALETSGIAIPADVLGNLQHVSQSLLKSTKK